MTRRRLPIDWDELETALTWRTEEGGGNYFDVETGKVIGFAGLDDDLTEDEIDVGLAEGRLIPIEPLPSSVEYGWMEDFAASVASPTLRRLLEVALDGSGVFRRFKNVLADHPADRERWFAFRDERVREVMREWLEEHDITPLPE
jgi:uncharacterized protein UPF0158